MAKAIYRNVTTDNEVYIIQRKPGPKEEYVHTYYTNFGRKAWYYKSDFDKLFEFSHVEYNI